MDDFAEKLSAANKASQDAALSVSAGTVNASVALVAKLFQPEGGSLRSGPEFGTLKRECMVLIKATVNRLALQDKSIGDDSGGQDNSSAISAAAAGLRFLAGLMEDPSLVIIVWQELFRIANHRPGIFRAAVQVADLGAELADSLQRTATHWCTDVLSMAGCMMQQQQQPPKPAVVAKTAKMMTMLAKYQASYVRTFGRYVLSCWLSECYVVKCFPNHDIVLAITSLTCLILFTFFRISVGYHQGSPSKRYLHW